MTDRPVPDVIALLVEWAADGFPEAEVTRDLPAAPAWPVVTVALVTGAEVAARHAYTALVQVDAWGVTHTQSSSTLRLLIDRLYQVRNTVYPAGTLTNVELIAGPTSGVDPEDPTRPRWRADVQLSVHV